jgi:hypothetical protein
MWLRVFGFASSDSGSMSIMIDLVLFILAVGFSSGFGWTLIRARAKARKAM